MNLPDTFIKVGNHYINLANVRSIEVVNDGYYIHFIGELDRPLRCQASSFRDSAHGDVKALLTKSKPQETPA